eukprot:TRINITY_DN1966_c0_g1::TRINITY_DN1966_c0_g1_i1::g.22933::m.22933 TRINITY_DN1966_c0_g1::TRINITY_DN1966_c0_g1_i1::g.22933  ORF type:complete len:401 (+),score=100.62,sp/Q93Y35/PSMD6_ARATH/48.02/5e-121,RPN7/PF10602.4/1.3e-53,PCI/PF01399.22/1.6e+03,PCI/PF01399.22/1.1e+03,PCI/PF01399.22/1.5e-16,FeoC/PF09012.5/1.2e+04,FeoC/PF09012.5/0.071 TRINITY_DN1966_c0_g1_i1:182-1204(+)
MAPYYELVCNEFNLPIDQTLLDSLKAANTEELNEIDKKIKDAEESLTESDVRKHLVEKSNFYSRIGDKTKSIEACEETLKKSVSMSQKLDVVMQIIRIALAFEDGPMTASLIDRAKKMIEEGGDWERRNRLKVYEGYHALRCRDFRKAADLFIDALPTFTATEVASYNTIVFYGVVTAMTSFKRPELKTKVVNSPEVLAALHEVPNLQPYLQSLYSCNYKQFMISLSQIINMLLVDQNISRHTAYYYRIIRQVAFSQFLESYQTVTLDSMARSFGVSVDFLDAELSRMIGSGKLTARIDKVTGLVETNRPDSKNAMYQRMIKNGDLLLNRIQKLGRVINM